MSLATAPGSGQSTRLTRLRAPLAAAAGVLAATAALSLRDPHQHGSWGLCPLKVLTGWNCPGCGGLRAVNDLTQGDLAAAAQSNLLLVVLIPLALAGWVLWVRRRWKSGDPVLGAQAVQSLTLAASSLAIAFAVFRNTPWGHGLFVS